MRKYAAILGNLGNTCDRFCGSYKDNPANIDYLELLYWLDECGYNGWLSMDQYPYREDAVGAIPESINWLKKFDSMVAKNRAELRKTVNEGNAVATSRLLRSILR